MTRDEILKEYDVAPGNPPIIKSLGKFEAEPIWAPYFWGMAMEMGAENEYENEAGEIVSWFVIDELDVKEFPELEDFVGKRIYLRESESGFVFSTIE